MLTGVQGYNANMTEIKCVVRTGVPGLRKAVRTGV